MTTHSASAEPLDAIRDAIAAAGPVIDPRATGALYADLHAREPYAGVEVRRDLRYGEDPRHLADLFVIQDDRPAPKPVLIFLHGGGYITGERRVRPGSPYHDNVGLWAAKRGFLAIVATYRLAPAAAWPAVPEDIAELLTWAADLARLEGGDPGAIFLMGHSAGASHIAGFLGRPQLRERAPAVRGAILMSPTTGPTPDEDALADETPFLGHERQYYGEDQARYGEQSVLESLALSPVELLVIGPEFDPPFFVRRFERLRAVFAHAQRPDSFVGATGHNHMSQIFAVNSSDRALTRQIELFVRHDQ